MNFLVEKWLNIIILNPLLKSCRDAEKKKLFCVAQVQLLSVHTYKTDRQTLSCTLSHNFCWQSHSGCFAKSVNYFRVKMFKTWFWFFWRVKLRRCTGGSRRSYKRSASVFRLLTTCAKPFHAASLPETTQTTIKSSPFSEKCVRCYSDIALLQCVFAWGCSHYSQSFYSK